MVSGVGGLHLSNAAHWPPSRLQVTENELTGKDRTLFVCLLQARMRVPFSAFLSRVFSRNISTGKWPSISTVRKWPCTRPVALLCVTRQGVIGIIWSIYWWHFSYERPATHPKISEEERIYIEESIGEACSISNKVRLSLCRDHGFSPRHSFDAKRRREAMARSDRRERCLTNLV